MKKTGVIVNIIVLLAGVAMIAYYLALGFAVRFGQSLQFLWLLGGIACIARCAFWEWARRHNFKPRRKKLLWALRACLLLGLAFFFAVEGLILAGGVIQPPAGLDYIIVLGARVDGRVPSGALRNRIDVAREYLDANPDTIAVLSGGQGPDEEISEAQCMFDVLTAAGIDPARLIIEDQSRDTSENLAFSRALIPEGSSAGVVSNNFHIFRARGLARAMGWDVAGVPVATSWFSIPHYYMREFVGVVYDGLRGNLAL